MDVELKMPQPRVIHTSEYVYLPKDSDNLCHTINFQWRRSRPIEVYFVIASELYVAMYIHSTTFIMYIHVQFM